jgi:pyruvate/2-oxoglutarate dehydrogenase complex dihydrolipoamide dehydrogenase (E3) component
VRETAKIANVTLTNIQNATEHMNASTRASIDSFNNFMDNAGDALRGQLVDHFDGLGKFLESQEKAARTTKVETDKFKALSDASVVTATGTTPVKKQFTPLRSLR